MTLAIEPNDINPLRGNLTVKIVVIVDETGLVRLKVKYIWRIPCAGVQCLKY